jgi:hypothetical protein
MTVDLLLFLFILPFFLNFKFKINQNIKYYTGFLIFFGVVYILALLAREVTFIDSLSAIRKNTAPFIITPLIYFYLADRGKIQKGLIIIFWLITADFIISFIIYHGLKVSPESYYPWSFYVSLNEGKEIFEGYKATVPIPTLYGYPYPHAEALVHAVLSFIAFDRYKSKLILAIALIAQFAVFIKTTLVAFIGLTGLYLLVYDRRLILPVISLLLVMGIVLINKIKSAFSFYNNFDLNTIADKFMIGSFFDYFKSVGLRDFLFGNKSFYDKGIGMSEVRVLVFLVVNGFFLFFLHMFIHLIPLLKGIKSFFLTGKKTTLLLLFIPIMILFDSLHYYFYFSFQNTVILTIVYLYIMDTFSEESAQFYRDPLGKNTEHVLT